MEPNLAAAFDNFRNTLIECQFSLADIFEFLSGFIEQQQAGISYALMSHMQDYLGELAESGGKEISFAEAMAEGYRRTFCDAETADMYGTAELTQQPEKVIGMLRFVSANLRTLHEADDPQQVLELAEATQVGQSH